MSNSRLFSLGPIESLADDEVIGIAITSDVGRDGDIWLPSGIDLTNFRANPIILRQHNPNCPVGSAVAIGLVDGGNAIGVRIKFAPMGASVDSDETRALVKAGVLRGISAGIDPIRTEPLDPLQPYGAWRVLEAELMEVSIVSIPADTNALVTQRAWSPRSLSGSLPALEDRSIQRMLRLASEPRRTTPPAQRSPAEQWDDDRRRTIAAWAAGIAETENDYARRQAECAALAHAGATDAPRPRRRRNRPYGL